MENKKYNILVNFEGNDSITSDPITIVKGDYNSVDFEFQINKTYNLALFFLIKPNGKEYVTAISDNTLTINDTDIFDVVGKYQFGVSIYDENSKLTIASKGKINVVDGLSTDSERVESDSNYQILDDLIKRVEILLPTYNENATTKLNEFNDNYIEKLNDFLNKTHDRPFFYKNISTMKTSNVKSGSLIETLGYYSANDGGGANYLIREKTDTDIEDGGLIHFLDNGLVAELLIENNVINIKQLGGKPQDINGKYDNKDCIDKYITILQTGNPTQRRIKLYIPSGIWHFSPTNIFNAAGYYIYGDETFTGPNREVSGTVITSYEDNQSHVWIMGDDEGFQQNITIKNLFLSTADFTVREDNKTVFGIIKKVTDTVMRIKRTQYLISDNLIFFQIHGQALGLSTSWELYFKLLNFRGVTSSGSVLNFEPLIGDGNISAGSFEKIMFEGFLHNLINISEGCGLGHCDIRTINIEDYMLGLSGFVENELVTNTSDFTDVQKGSIFNFEANAFAKGISVNNILINNFAHYIRTYENTKYVFDTVLRCRNKNQLDIVINNIQCQGILKDCDLIYTANNTDGMVTLGSLITINNCINNDWTHKMKFNLVGGFNGTIVADNLNLEQQTAGGMSIKSHNFSYIEPFYKFTNNRYIGRGLMYSDEEALNHLRLVVKPLKNTEGTDTVFAKMPFYTKTLKIRAKVPEGETAIIDYNVDSKTSIPVELIGTGSFKWYTLFENDTTGTDDSIIGMLSKNLTTECLIDCVKYL